MTPKTRTTVISALARVHDELLTDLHLHRMTHYVKGRDDHARRTTARGLRETRAALRELRPRRWPAAYAQPDQALVTYQREGR